MSAVEIRSTGGRAGHRSGHLHVSDMCLLITNDSHDGDVAHFPHNFLVAVSA